LGKIVGPTREEVNENCVTCFSLRIVQELKRAIYSGPNRVSFPFFPFHLKKQVGLASEMWDVWLKTLNYIQNIIHNYRNMSGVQQHGLHTSFLKLAQVLCRKAVGVTYMYCCVYSARLLMMDRKTVRNM
jgi:hypothetical protein